jgi:glycosyltransferase involved in cell wall biosynthesis
MYPSEDKPYAGIFVKNQFQKIKSLLYDGESVDIKCMKRRITGKLGSIYKYFIFFLSSLSLFKKKYDVIHLHYLFPLAIIPYCYKKLYPDCKVIITSHGSDIYRFMNYGMIAFFYKKFAKTSDIFISVGQDLAEEIKDTLDIEPDLILSAGVDQETFFKEKNCEKKYDFLFVGSFVKRKGVDLICETIREDEKADISFCFVGSGPLEPELLNLKEEGYDITIKKNKTQEELRTIYNQAKWFLFPSRNEPFGLVVTESIFCGTPVLTSKTGGIKEQVKDGHNGYFIETTEGNSINQSIDRVLSLDDQKYEEIVEKCLHSNIKFSLTQVCKKLVDIYRE